MKFFNNIQIKLTYPLYKIEMDHGSVHSNIITQTMFEGLQKGLINTITEINTATVFHYTKNTEGHVITTNLN